MNEQVTTQALTPDQCFIGIDLGTTHILLWYLLPGAPSDAIQGFEFRQLVGHGQIGVLPHLPAFRFHPANVQFDADQTALDFPFEPLKSDESSVIFGEWARVLGSKTQGRLVSSAKTWLSESAAAKLPLVDESAQVFQCTAVTAVASYLNYVKALWDDAHPDFPLAKQQLVITIPASFDEMARAATLDAIHTAGLSVLALLEEPTAAAYHWFHAHYNREKPQGMILVCDMGGGTTDFTLLRVEKNQDGGGAPDIERLAVGDNLLLGGDNMDWTLAHHVKAKLESNQVRLKLSQAQWSQLVQSCRLAKERLLGDSDLAHTSVTLMGQGRALVGAQLTETLYRDDLQTLLVEGFFPLVDFSAEPYLKTQALRQQGLAFAKDPAVTRHLARFLNRVQGLNAGVCVDYVLFNGGVFRCDAFKNRLLQQLNHWGFTNVDELRHHETHVAVARGAVVYQLARKGLAFGIRGGSARSYFLLIETEEGDAQGLCILPQGTTEEQVLMSDRRFNLKVGEPARFQIYSSTQDANLAFGRLFDVKDHWVRLTPLVLTIEMGADLTEVPVKLEAKLSELGVLQLKCVLASEQPPNLQAVMKGVAEPSWDLNFNLRSPHDSCLSAVVHETVSKQPDADMKLPGAVTQAFEQVFGARQKKPDIKVVKQLRHRLEIHLGPREQWSLDQLRSVADQLMVHAKSRRRSEIHERSWFNLLGYCLRPGFGHAGDSQRLIALNKVLEGALGYPKLVQNQVEFWTFWRRVSPGLDGIFQQRLWQMLKPKLSKHAAKGPHLNAQQLQRKITDVAHLIRAAAALERLNLDDKQWLGQWLFEWAKRTTDHEVVYWGLGRVAARVLVHADAVHVLDLSIVEPWFDYLMAQSFGKKPWVALAATLIARVADDVSKAISPDKRDTLIHSLKQNALPETWIALLTRSEDPVSADQLKQILGESLPLGLRL